jgi:hypothetical protein
MFKILFFFLIIANIEMHATNQQLKRIEIATSTLNALLELNPQMPGFVYLPFRRSIGANSSGTHAKFFGDPAVKLAEDVFEGFSKRKDPVKEFTIPPLIHLIWLGSTPPEKVRIVCNSWRKHHPHFTVKLWTDSEIASFVWSQPRAKVLFSEAESWAEKADILRLEILYQFGGIYSDTDVICLKSFEELLHGPTFIAGFEEDKIKTYGRPLIGSALFCARQGHPLLKRCLDYCLPKKDAPQLDLHLRSGPGPLTRASYEALESGQEGILLLPCSYFYPLPWEKRTTSLEVIKKAICPESFAIHLWEGSWF